MLSQLMERPFKYSPIARHHSTWIVCGFAEIDGDRLFHSALIIDHTGELVGVYRKVISMMQIPWADSGNQRMLFGTPFGQWLNNLHGSP